MVRLDECFAVEILEKDDLRVWSRLRMRLS